MGWRTTALWVVVVGACAGGERLQPEERSTERRSSAAVPAKKTSADGAAAVAEPAPAAADQEKDLRSRLGRIFHTLPPPEALESPQPCDSRISPTDGGPLALLDSALLEALGTRLTPADLAGREAALAAQLEDWAGLSSPVFTELHRLAVEGGPKEREAALEAEAAAMLAGGRLGVMLTEERSIDPGRYRGWLVLYAMESELPFCWLRVEAQGSSSSIEADVQAAASAGAAKIVPGLQLRWDRGAASELGVRRESPRRRAPR